MSAQTVAREVAEAEFQRWADAMRLTRKLDLAKMSDADKAALGVLRECLLDAMQDGQLVVDEEGRFVLAIAGVEPLVFNKPTGASVMAMDQAKGTEPTRKLVKFLADMTKRTTDTFAKLDLVDLQVCDSIAQLFLAK